MTYRSRSPDASLVRFRDAVSASAARHVSARDATRIQKATMRAWERFVSGCADADDPAVGDVLGASWRRSVASGVSPTGREAPLVAQGDALFDLHRRHAELLDAAAGIFSATDDILRDSSTIMLLANQAGVVLQGSGDVRTMAQGQHVHLMVGGDWRESVVGTNGMGMALATGQPVQVHAAEHFCEAIKAWTCAAAPIHDPATGAVMGVIDISGPPQTYQRNNLTLAVAAARQIELILAEQMALDRMRLLQVCARRLSGMAAAGTLAVDRWGKIVFVNGQVPYGLAFGDSLPGAVAHASPETWRAQLPDGLRAEWLDTVVEDGKAIGALIVVPGEARVVRAVAKPAVTPRVAKGGAQAGSFDQLVGRSEAMCQAVARGRKVAPHRVPVLVHGETGTGKELFARALHGEGNPGGPFVTFNCGATTRELIGAELFGHVRGAFTGATNEGRPGRFELAHGGTLCLDEIGELPLELQPVLLRVLEEGVVYRLGDSQPRPVDVRVVSLTNRHLPDEVAEGRFRRDLYHRIGVVTIEVPPLRERAGDVALLIDHFNGALSTRHGVPALTWTDDAMAAMLAHRWEGNVRELRNAVESLLLVGDGNAVTLADLPPGVGLSAGAAASPQEVMSSLADAERAAIAQALLDADGNVSRAARRLGVSRSTLYRKLGQYGMGVLEG